MECADRELIVGAHSKCAGSHSFIRSRSDLFAINSHVPEQFKDVHLLPRQAGSLRRHLGALWTVIAVITAPMREQRPRNARILVGQCHRDHVHGSPREQLSQPRIGSLRMTYGLLQHGAGTVNQQRPQVTVATLADPQQFGLAAGRVLPRYDAQAGRQLSRIAERSTPCTWKTFFARSIPIVVTFMRRLLSCEWVTSNLTLAPRCRIE